MGVCVHQQYLTQGVELNSRDGRSDYGWSPPTTFIEVFSIMNDTTRPPLWPPMYDDTLTVPPTVRDLIQAYRLGEIELFELLALLENY